MTTLLRDIMSREQAEGMAVADLRKACREAGLMTGHSFAGTRKEDLVNLLSGEMSEAELLQLAAERTGQLMSTVNPLNGSQGHNGGGDLAALIAQAVSPLVRGALDEARVVELIQEHAPKSVTTIEVKRPDGRTVNVGTQHKQFPLLLACCAARMSAYLVGPAGTGKSHAARAAAVALDIPYHDMSVGPMTSKSDIMGFVDAGGHYQPTAFRRAFEDGGVFLFDEIDAAHPGVLTLINGALSNGGMTFPDGYVRRHPDFVCVAAANTFGNGADRQYVGRNQLDAATLDRFAFIDWPIDEELETAICGGDSAWLALVRKVRASVAANGLRHVVSPRASLAGLALLAQGVTMQDAAEMLLYKGLDATARGKVGAA